MPAHDDREEVGARNLIDQACLIALLMYECDL